MFPALLDESGLKPSLATNLAEASLRVNATLLGQGESWEHGCWDRVSATSFKTKICRGDMRYAAREGFDWSS
ncbi:hypothetical protein SAMN02746098_00818 [Desulfosporosinus lacus DSM 15449]|uniref:Uncharacterized protein n=1 Tax=Desulfosporosinus lacus DSM 15449 TaxID=1121420 RepID=A0A1M5SD09_9FIRM|nr:hypothetical protein SAMN02746098_00818 [Desulfosporosinus lacus DSM 15449]